MGQRNYKLGAAVAMLIIAAGCASSSGGGGSTVTTSCTTAACVSPTAVPTSTPTSTTTTTGTSTGTLVPTSTSALAQLFFNSNPNTPENIEIALSLSSTTESVVISYTEQTTGALVQANFGIVNPTNPSYSSNSLNGWVNQNGTTIWKGFFQDQYGAIVLIVDSLQSQGDGKPGLASGSVWFQNFNTASPNFGVQGPLKMCWEISLGPFDCRTFLVNNQVQMTSTYYPTNKGPNASANYTELGTFSGIDLTTAGFPAQ